MRKKNKLTFTATLVISLIAISTIAAAAGFMYVPVMFPPPEPPIEYNIKIELDDSLDIDEQREEVSDLLYEYYFVTLNQSFMPVISIIGSEIDGVWVYDEAVLHHRVSEETLEPVLLLLEENGFSTTYSLVNHTSKKDLMQDGNDLEQDGEEQEIDDSLPDVSASIGGEPQPIKD